MARITGLGGVFFRSADPAALAAWYGEPLLAHLRAIGTVVDEKVDDSEYGRFGWFSDPDGNRVELWQPPGT